MSNIFENDSDSDVEIKIDNQYAKSYNIWRKKEEINKFKTKYGDDVNLDEESSSSSSDDEEGAELTEEIERNFFKTLSYLKNKDPQIYNENAKFFQDRAESNTTVEKKKKDVPMYLRDYERKIILEKGGVFSDEEEGLENKPKPTTYVDEQEHIKESLRNVLNAVGDDEDNDENGGGLCKERQKTQEEKGKEDDYKKWLAGEREKINEEVESELKPLKEYWNDPNLDEGEKFLRDYILNKKFLDKGNNDYIPTYDEVIHDSDQDLSNDEETIEKQEEFEHKYNFRFEEPDQDFIKRYPRTMENSVRKVDDRRKVKRQEIKERKKKEKQEKMQELKKFQELKRKEIEEKLEKLKEITGNTDIEFADEDIDGDFDPEAHDKRMQSLFNDDYYHGPEEEQKPEFPEIDKELDIENWERYEEEIEVENPDAPHCEDDNFNMDCDYDPNMSTQNELIEKSKGKKKRKRKSKVAEALSKPKPKFDPNDKNYEQYFDEYYKLDCEDIIGDIPCRFKYRKVVPNDFGLSIEEILLAKERELNKWCSLKKAVQFRPDHIEKYDQIAYKKKAENINLKKRVLPSLFTPDPEEETVKDIEKNKANITTSETNSKNDNMKANDMRKNDNTGNQNSSPHKSKTKKKANKSHKGQNNVSEQSHNLDSVTTEVKESEVKNKIRKNTENNEFKCSDQSQKQKKKQRKRKVSVSETEINTPRKKLKKNRDTNKNQDCAISDARLSAYGINPKKFKNKLKYSK